MSELRKGLRVELNDVPHLILETQFVKPGKGQAFTRLKLKNLITGSIIDKTCKIGEKLPASNIAEKNMQYLYQEKEDYIFMDMENYDQIAISKEQIGSNSQWLAEGMEVKVLLHKENTIGVELPPFCYQEITYAEPGIKGDRVSKATKRVTLASGAELQVPLFINTGDKVKIDTRNGEYVERA